MEDLRRILFVKPSSLGDIVHAMPTLSALRRAYPTASITWLVKRQWAPIVERIEGVDRVWPLDPGFSGWCSQVPALRRAKFDVAVDLQGLLRSALMTRLSGAPRRFGFANARESSPYLYTHRISVPTVDIHAVDRYLLAAAAMGVVGHGPVEFRFRALQGDQEQVDQLMRQAGLAPGMDWVAMNVCARWPTKRWAAASYAALADRLVDEGLGPVAFIGGPDERSEVAAVRTRMKAESFDFSGKVPLGILPAVLRKAGLLITNDSGPMHVAAAVGTPVVALFGPTNPVRTGPYGVQHEVLVHKVPCSPCYSRSCRNPNTMECLTGVTPEQVMSAARAQLALRVTVR